MRIKIGLALLLCILTMGVLRAQDVRRPLIMVINGDIWSWDGSSTSLKQLTNWGYNEEISLSPDGTKVAYVSFPMMIVNFLNTQGGIGGGTLPTNIWVMDIASGNASRIADQPPDASFFVQGVPDKAVVRSLPAWSPDGKAAAWSEYDFQNDQQQRLVVYDFASGLSRTVVSSLPPQYGVPAPVGIGWNSTGIIVHSITPDSQIAAGYDDTFMTYSPTGKLIASFAAAQGEYLTDSLPVTMNGHDYVAARYVGGSWKLFDLQTGQSLLLAGVPQPYNPLAPDAPPVVQVASSADGRSYVLYLLDSQGRPVGEPVNAGFGLDRIVISPDGRAAAFTRFNSETSVYQQQIEIWRDGQLVSAPTTDSVYYAGSFAWGPLAWRIGPSGNPQTGFSCPGALPARLAVGDLAQVIPGGGPNNLRDTPALNGAKTGQIPESGVFSVTGGPVCADGLVWWQVNYSGQTGWTVESQNGTYYLEKVS